MRDRIGYVYGVSAYLLWGLFPLYFLTLTDINPFELIPWRVLACLFFCAVFVAVLRKWGPLREVLRSPKSRGWFVLSSLLLYANWQIFVIAVMTGHVIETALGYFINPLVTILLGVVIRREKLRPTQWVAVGIATVGLVVTAVAYGTMPWIALGLAGTFSLYGFVRKQANERIDALSGLTVETLAAVPFALVQLIIVGALAAGAGLPVTGLSFDAFQHGHWVFLLVLGSGLVTAIPLLLFGAANRRLPLTHMGFLQFITPILNFITGAFILHEPMDPARWIGFTLVWVALGILMTEAVRSSRRR
ncbi:MULTISPECIES: EamA family transporter RarD [unclassified Leucobacter]|uniref:EamA family transporter RarD n=1 Tax=unclassified Leucobacter TaxID=2621730 RepID=UPI00165E0C0D|nr:EamA family transporter RarD [Leucobacter sp. cx-87]